MEQRQQALEEEQMRREELERRLREETHIRQKLIEREVKLREKQRTQVRQWEFDLVYKIGCQWCKQNETPTDLVVLVLFKKYEKLV